MALPRLKIVETIEEVSGVRDQRTLVNLSVQIALNTMSEWHDWPYYIQDKGVIETVDDYSTGTVAITNGETTATVTTGVVAAGWVGRKVRFEGQNAFYRIKSVSTGANTFVLEHSYQGTTLTVGTYIIYKDEYRLASDVDKYKLLRQAENNIALFSLHPSRFDQTFPMPQAYADPVYEIMEGTLLDTYSTGTVTATGKTLTGSATALWTSVEGLDRMSMIRIGNNVYHVKSVDSATQITTYETVTTVSAATAYEITLNNLRVQLYNIPNEQRLVYYRYFRLPAILANNYDLPDMPFQWHWILIYGGLELAFLQKGDIKRGEVISGGKFEKALERMKLKIGSFTPDRIYQKQSQDRFRTLRGFTDGLEKANFDRRYSAPY